MFQDSPNYVTHLATCGPAFLFNLGFCLLSPHLDRLFRRLPSIPRFIFSRLSTVLFFCNMMLLWRSFWNFFTMVFITDVDLILSFLLTTAVCVGFGCYNTLNGVPASVSLDLGEEHVTVATLMQVRTQPSNKPPSC